MPKITAMCSCPRLGFLDFMGQSIAAFVNNGIAYQNLYGVFWHQALSGGILDALENNDYIITTDYDSIYTTETVAQLVRLAEQNPHADAICTMQMGRFSGLLVSTEDGKLAKHDLMTKPLVPIKTGHFGLTIFRTSAFKDLEKPWFWSKPDEDGEWKRNGKGKEDEDIYFWKNFDASGKRLFVAPRLVIGHLELLMKWPSDNLDGIYQTTADFAKNGPPSDVWR
jgi:hypothetical protein